MNSNFLDTCNFRNEYLEVVPYIFECNYNNLYEYIEMINSS